MTPARILEELKAYQESGINVARLASGLAVVAVGGDVGTAAFAGGNAAEHNALCGGLCIGVVAALLGYVSYSGDGDLGEGLAAIGAGQDPLSRAVSAGAARSVRWSSTRYPDITAAVLGALEATGGAIEATIVYLDDKTRQRVSRRWNELPEHTRNQIKGGGIVASFLLPAASVGKIGQYAKTGKLPDATSRTLTRIDNPVDLTNGRSDHILNNHRFGAGKPNKTEFPSNWDDQRIIHNISDVAIDTNAVRGIDSRGTPYAEGVRDGVKIRVIFFPDDNVRAGQISSAYPTDLPVNPR